MYKAGPLSRRQRKKMILCMCIQGWCSLGNCVWKSMQKSITKTLTLETNSTLHHDSCYCQMKESNCSLCRGHQTRSALQHESFYYQMIELNCSLCRDHQTNSTLHHESCYYQMKKSNYSLCIIICQSPKPMNCILLVSEDTTHDKWVLYLRKLGWAVNVQDVMILGWAQHMSTMSILHLLSPHEWWEMPIWCLHLTLRVKWHCMHLFWKELWGCTTCIWNGKVNIITLMPWNIPKN